MIVLHALGALCSTLGLLLILKGYEIAGSGILAVGLFWLNTDAGTDEE